MTPPLTFNPASVLVRDALEFPDRRTWTMQGLGMLRTYLQDDVRLHVWDPARGNGASPVHTHPWDFVSYVVAGRLTNIRYSEDVLGRGLPHFRRTIRPGEQLEVIGADELVGLRRLSEDVVRERGWYFQDASEIHESRPDPGTVTLIKRHRRNLPDTARTYYPLGQQWSSGEPRAATPEEVRDICRLALQRWFR